MIWNLCFGWEQGENDDFDWEFTSGTTPSGRNRVTGPPFDHTQGTSGEINMQYFVN